MGNRSNRTRILAFSLLSMILFPAVVVQAEVSMENSFMQVMVNPEDGRIAIKSRKTEQVSVVDARLFRKTASAKVAAISDPKWGAGSEILVEHEDGSRSSLRLFSGSPFLRIHTSVHNSAGEPLVVKSLEILDMNVSLDGQKLMSYGTGGLRDPSSKQGSYSFHAFVNGDTRAGLVSGYLTHDRGVGVFLPGAASSTSRPETCTLKTQIDFGRFQVDPGKTRGTDTLLVGFFDDARLGLEAYADSVAAHYDVRLKPRPNVYCTWYHAGASSEEKIAQNTEFAATHLRPYGLNVMQIDDKWQAILPKDFKHEGRIQTTGPIKVFVDTQGNYPKGMAYTAQKIASHGMVAGIWFMPFAGNFRNPYFDPEIFAKNADGTPFHDSRWSGTCLDASNPKAQTFLRQRVKRIYDWGYRYFKIDGMHTGMPSNNIYVHTAYRDQNFGKSVLHDPNTTHIEAYRTGLNILREAAPDVFVLGCNVSQNMMCMGPAFDLIDGMRIGPDNGGAGGGSWGAVTKGAWHGTNLYFLNGRVWYNDPDPVYVRPSNPIDYARWMCSWLAVAGGMHTSSEQYAGLPAERLDLLRRCLPGHDLPARPVDLFETDKPRIWHVEDGRLHLVGLFNWKNNDAEEIVYDMDKLGLDKSITYAAFDYWENKFVEPVKGTLKQTLPGGTCRILAMRPRADHPQLLSTSRHITQGLIDVLDERWDAGAGTLSGKSRVVGNDPYELRIALPAAGSWKVLQVSAEGAAIKLAEQNGGGVRVLIDAAESREVSWRIKFQ